MHRVLFVLLIASAALPSLAAPTALRLLDAATAAARVALERPVQATRVATSLALARPPAWHWTGEFQQALQRAVPANQPGIGGEARRVDGRALAAKLRDMHALITRGATTERPHRF